MNRRLRRGQARKAKQSQSRGGSGAAALDNALATASRHHQAGRLRQAGALYRKILNAHPGNPDTLHLFGVLQHQLGRHEEAIGLLGDAVRAAPDQAPFHYNLAEACRLTGRFDDAVASYRRARELAPDMADISLGLGKTLLELGDLDAAIECIRRAIELAPDDAEMHADLGQALADAGRAEDALASYRQALALDPGMANVHTGIAMVLESIGRGDEARAGFARALDEGADPYPPHMHLGLAEETQGVIEAAIDHYRQAAAAEPESAEAWSALGYATLLRGDPEVARTHIAKAIELDPDLAAAHFALGFYHQQQGRFADAITGFERALELDPGQARALYALATLDTGDEPEAKIARIEESLARSDAAGGDRAGMEFALARLYDETGRFDDAFRRYLDANAGMAVSKPFDAAAHARATDQLIAAVDEEFFAARATFGDDSEVPVFVIGMLRSGTTLVEQILASHPGVHGAGELDDMRRLIASLPERLGSAEVYPRSLFGLDRALSRALAAEQLASLAKLAPAAARVVDKTPNNFLRLPFIALLFPRAKIIHTRRDPLDTCVSCFFQDFAIGQEFSYDLAALGSYYRDYDRLIAHWRKVLPIEMLELDYEALVSDQEEASRRLIDFCGLDWDPACLRFYETRRTVRTASLWQVRQPIYGSSVGRWRRYERHLRPLVEALGPDIAGRSTGA